MVTVHIHSRNDTAVHIFESGVPFNFGDFNSSMVGIKVVLYSIPKIAVVPAFDVSSFLFKKLA